LSSVVIQTAFLGDVVLTTPLLQALAEREGSPVDVVTTPAAVPLLETHAAVRRVWPFDKHGTEKGLGALRRFAASLRAERYQTAWLPHRSLRTAALAWLARIPRRVGFHDGWRFLYTDVRRRPDTGHEIDRLLSLADVPPRRYQPAIELKLSDVTAAEKLLRDEGLKPGEPFVALAPGSIWGTKRWPYYKELAQHLTARGARIVVVGGKDDWPLGEQIAVTARRLKHPAVNACGKLALRESVAVISKAMVLITNDSAPLHFATAVGTPVVAVFGPTVPAFGFGPRGPRDMTVGVEGLPCRPCSRHGPATCPLGHHRCMNDLPVERVLAAIEETGALPHRN
jgi:lipopolysaccharide heptosyltransferase II